MGNISAGRKIAIYGGSFNPVHNAHLALAEFAVKELSLDELIFMPAYISPFKQNQEICDGADRYAMLEAVAHYNKAFSVSDFELSRKGPSYTIDTLNYLDEHLDGKLYFVLGYDSIVELESWCQGPEILKRFALITARRPDTEDITADERIKYYIEKYNSEIHVLHMPLMDISSSDIRSRVKEGKDISNLVPREVEEYIFEHKLYQ